AQGRRARKRRIQKGRGSGVRPAWAEDRDRSSRGGEVMKVAMKVNGVERTGDVELCVLLVDFLRSNLSVTDTHIGCDTSSCGASTVLVAGEPIKSCRALAVLAD